MIAPYQAIRRQAKPPLAKSENNHIIFKVKFARRPALRSLQRFVTGRYTSLGYACPFESQHHLSIAQ